MKSMDFPLGDYQNMTGLYWHKVNKTKAILGTKKYLKYI